MLTAHAGSIQELNRPSPTPIRLPPPTITTTAANSLPTLSTPPSKSQPKSSSKSSKQTPSLSAQFAQIEKIKKRANRLTTAEATKLAAENNLLSQDRKGWPIFTQNEYNQGERRYHNFALKPFPSSSSTLIRPPEEKPLVLSNSDLSKLHKKAVNYNSGNYHYALPNAKALSFLLPFTPPSLLKFDGTRPNSPSIYDFDLANGFYEKGYRVVYYFEGRGNKRVAEALFKVTEVEMKERELARPGSGFILEIYLGGLEKLIREWEDLEEEKLLLAYSGWGAGLLIGNNLLPRTLQHFTPLTKNKKPSFVHDALRRLDEARKKVYSDSPTPVYITIVSLYDSRTKMKLSSNLSMALETFLAITTQSQPRYLGCNLDSCGHTGLIWNTYVARLPRNLPLLKLNSLPPPLSLAQLTISRALPLKVATAGELYHAIVEKEKVRVEEREENMARASEKRARATEILKFEMAMKVSEKEMWKLERKKCGGSTVSAFLPSRLLESASNLSLLPPSQSSITPVTSTSTRSTKKYDSYHPKLHGAPRENWASITTTVTSLDQAGFTILARELQLFEMECKTGPRWMSRQDTFGTIARIAKSDSGFGGKRTVEDCKLISANYFNLEQLIPGFEICWYQGGTKGGRVRVRYDDGTHTTQAELHGTPRDAYGPLACGVYRFILILDAKSRSLRLLYLDGKPVMSFKIEKKMEPCSWSIKRMESVETSRLLALICREVIEVSSELARRDILLIVF